LLISKTGDFQKKLRTSSSKPCLIIPVENQVRELDPKLLLACVAARRGFTSFMGFRREMHFQIGAFPRGVYVSKSMTRASDMMFAIMRKLGHEVVAWDEEALVHLPPEIYYSRRLSAEAMQMVSHFFAWGEDSAELWRRYPRFPAGTPVHVTGNPRCDLLRSELHAFYEADVRNIRARFGDFILINTNFNHVNGFSPVQNLFQPCPGPGEEPQFGRAAHGMTREYAEGLQTLKRSVFSAFQQMIPALETAFPDHMLVVRPHPTENPEVYRRIAEQCTRVRVTNEGNVVPWLLATKVLIHNGCTTGVEAYVMGVPAVSYRAYVDEDYDYGFYRLPNLVSHQVFSLEELQPLLNEILAGKIGAADGQDRKAVIDRHLAALDGKLACERIVDVLETMGRDDNRIARPAWHRRMQGRLWASARALVKRTKAHLPRSHNKPAFQRHRYPEISVEDMRSRVQRFQSLLGSSVELSIEPIQGKFFRIGAC
jgi:surface carbohydrate biosynthesis protein